MRRPIRALAAALAVVALAATTAVASTGDATAKLTVSPYRLPDATIEQLRGEFIDQVLDRHEPGTWAPLRFDLGDQHLAKMGLPPAHVLRGMDFSAPTMVDRHGNTERVELPALATVAGAGWFGIRPGGLLLLIDDQGIGWCSLAHVFGSPGSYKISTAGHCGKTGTKATMIAAFGNRAGVTNPILLDFGKFSTSKDAGPGADWALIDVEARYQHLVTPTMAFWGGPRGTFTKTGAVAGLSFPGNSLIPSVSVNPDPFLAQQIVHYGHGTAVGTGGTPRSGTALHWGKSHYMFFGAISPGDSGSGANTLLGDAPGDTMEAAGIMTHLWVDPLMRNGLGVMAGTRTTVIRSALANGQLVSYPVPAPILP